MGKRTNCCVPGCSNVRGKVHIAYYRIPKAPPKRRRNYIRLIGRDWRWKPVDSTRICAAHFVNGEKSDWPESLSYLPSIGLPFSQKTSCKSKGSTRALRATRGARVNQKEEGNDNPRCQAQQQQHGHLPQVSDRCVAALAGDPVIDSDIHTEQRKVSPLKEQAFIGDHMYAESGDFPVQPMDSENTSEFQAFIGDRAEQPSDLPVLPLDSENTGTFEFQTLIGDSAKSGDLPVERPPMELQSTSDFQTLIGDSAKSGDLPVERPPMELRSTSDFQTLIGDSAKSGDLPVERPPVDSQSTLDFQKISTDSNSLTYFDHDYVFGHWKLLSVADHQEVTSEIKSLRAANRRLKADNAKLKAQSLGLDLIRASNVNCQRYTGLPNYATFKAIFEFLEDDAKELIYWDGKKTLDKSAATGRGRGRTKLTLEEEFFVTLVRLKLNMPLFDLSRQLGVAVGHLSNLIVTWVHFLASSLEELIEIPQYADIEGVLSDKAKEFPGTRIIVDCTEWYTQRPSHLMPRKQIWSNYKHENTFKWLVGVSLKGAFCFVSEPWGGRASDKCITNACGLLDKLNPGDGLMADRGFDMETELSARGIDLHIPSFKGSNRAQLTSLEVHYSRRVAAVRIQVERAIGKMKSFHIFDKKLPLSMANSASAIFKTCAFLTNFQQPVLKVSH